MHVNSVTSDLKILKKLKFLSRLIFFEFLKIRIIRKVTTDLENHTKPKRQTETKACVVLDMDDKAVPYKTFSIDLGSGSIHFAHFRFECKKKKKFQQHCFNVKNRFPQILSKAFIDESTELKTLNYRTDRFVYMVARRNAQAFSHCIQWCF